jgi:spore coat protein CotH
MIRSIAIALLTCSPAAAQTPAERSDDFFSAKEPVPTLKIELEKGQLDLLKKDPRKYVRATIRNGTTVYRDVGLHLKGAAGSFRNWDDKPALTINSDKFKKNQSFNGMDKFHLNNSVQDGSFFNELIASDLFNACKVPAPRCTHAIVELNGRKVGLYLVKEGFDQSFLARHFERTDGNLYDGGFLRDIDQELELDSGKPCEWADLNALTKACREHDHAKRLAAMDKHLDLDRFVAYWVIEVLTCDWDGYTRNRNNYRIYKDPKTEKFVFFAHGKDQLFGNTGDALIHGWGGLCARRLFETDAGRKRYTETLKSVFAKQFDIKTIDARIDALTPRVVKALESVNKDWARDFANEAKQEKARIKARIEWVKEELGRWEKVKK